jgi:thiamine phosphate synthase YjbQ (UPF0047 family)
MPCECHAHHASVFINDNESGLHHEYEVWLEKLAPHAPTSQYHHNRTGEDNADAHLKRQFIGREVVMPDQILKLGTFGISIWWDIYFLSEAEQDSPESKLNL